MMKDELNVYDKYSILNLKCQSCQRVSHPFMECPLMNNHINKLNVILKYQNSGKQNRVLFRSFHKKKNTLKLIKELNNSELKGKLIFYSFITFYFKKKMFNNY